MSLDTELGLIPPAEVQQKREPAIDYSDDAVATRKRQREWQQQAEQSRKAAGVGDPLLALVRFFVTPEQVEQMQKTRMIYLDLIAHQHLAVWSAPAGDGKTTLAMEAAGSMARDGLRVLFLQEDASAGDLPDLYKHATENGYGLLNSTLANSAPEEQIDVLHRLVESEAPLGEFVFIFDTMKKFADLMSKGGTREFLRLMRSLTQRGATVILLGHTNKHKGPDGKLVFEGVGDVRNDVDELLYIEATEKDPAGMRTMTIKPDKARCAIKEATFQLDTSTRELRLLDRVVDVSAVLREKRQREEDQALIDVVTNVLSAGGMNHTVLVDRAIKESGRSRATVDRVITRYLSDELGDPHALWLETRLRMNNSRHIALMPRVAK